MNSNSIALKIRINSMLSPISSNWSQMLIERFEIEKNLLQMLFNDNSNEIASLDSNMDRIPFYIVYHGFNDRYMQELFSLIYHKYINNINFHGINLLNINKTIDSFNNEILLLDDNNKLSDSMNYQPKRNIRIGFMSKFFGIFEPHGLLLDGIIKYLPRNIFQVIVLPVARTDSKPLAYNIIHDSDELYEIPFMHNAAAKLIASLNIDIIIFADVLSEPVNYYLAYARLAKVQVIIYI